MTTPTIPSTVRRALLLGGAGAAAGLFAPAGFAAGPYSGEVALPLYRELTDNIPMIVGLERGFFKDAGLNLKPVSYSVPSDIIRAVTTNTDIGAASMIAGLVARTRGFENLRIVGAYMGKLVIDFVVPVGSPIRSPKDLAGKTIGVNVPSSIVTYFARSMLKEVGIDPDKDVKLVDVKGAGPGATALENGVVDCTWSTPPLQSRLEITGKVRSIYKAGEHFPDMQQSAIFSRKEFLDQNESTVKAFLQAVEKSQNFVRSDPAAATRIYAKFLEIDEKIAAETIRTVAPSYTTGVSRKGFAVSVEAARALGLLTQDLAYEAVVDTRFAKIVA
jgi:NitT/TauT family transport system substrate-binding protein